MTVLCLSKWFSAGQVDNDVHVHETQGVHYSLIIVMVGVVHWPWSLYNIVNETDIWGYFHDVV